MVPNHRLLGMILLEIFYRALAINSRAMAYTISGGSFIRHVEGSFGDTRSDLAF